MNDQPRHRPTTLRSAAIRAISVLALAVSTVPAGAQELEPRAYRTMPVGLNFVVVSAGLSKGNVVVDPSLPIEDLEATIDSWSVGYLRSLSVAGRSASVTVFLPYVHASVSGRLEGEFMSGSRGGTADMRARLAVNLLGGPALRPEEFANYQQKRNVGVSLTVAAPTGQYDPTRLINFGANRWSLKPEIGYSSIRGPWIFEAAAGVWFFSRNENHLNSTVDQTPIGSLQGHVSYNFKSGIWLGFDINYFSGGRTTVDDMRQRDLQESSRTGLTLSLPVGRTQSVKLAFQTGAFTRIGADFDVGAVAYQFGW